MTHANGLHPVAPVTSNPSDEHTKLLSSGPADALDVDTRQLIHTKHVGLVALFGEELLHFLSKTELSICTCKP
jgi:hypothetical protein